MYFSNLKEKRQKAYRIESYDEVFTNTLISMFTYRGDSVPEEILEYQSFIDIYSMLDGACAIWKLTSDRCPNAQGDAMEGKWIITPVDFAGSPNAYGFGADAICTVKSGVVVKFDNWRENPDVAIIFNNSNYSPDMNIGRFSDMLAELEVSMKLNVLFARMYPMPVASSAKIQKAVEAAIENMRNGKIATILDDDTLSKYVADTTTAAANTGIQTVNLTEVEKSQYIQYLAKFRDDLMRWFYSLYGMNSQGSSKMAQQTVDEVNQDNNASMILPHDMLRMRMKSLENQVNKKFGWDMEVSFSECWQSRLANMDDEFKTTDEQLEEGVNNEEEQTAAMETGTEEDTQGMDGENEAPEATEGADGTQEIEEIKETVEDIQEVVEEIKKEVEDGDTE